MPEEQVMPMTAIKQIISLDMDRGPAMELNRALEASGKKQSHGLAGGGDIYVPVSTVQQFIDDGTLPIRETKPNTDPATVQADVDRVLADYELRRPVAAAKA